MNALDVLCAQLTRDLFAIAKFLLSLLLVLLLLSSYLHDYPCFICLTMASHYCINRRYTASLLSTTDQYFI